MQTNSLRCLREPLIFIWEHGGGIRIQGVIGRHNKWLLADLSRGQVQGHHGSGALHQQAPGAGKLRRWRIFVTAVLLRPTRWKIRLKFHNGDRLVRGHKHAIRKNAQPTNLTPLLGQHSLSDNGASLAIYNLDQRWIAREIVGGNRLAPGHANKSLGGVRCVNDMHGGGESPLRCARGIVHRNHVANVSHQHAHGARAHTHNSGRVHAFVGGG